MNAALRLPGVEQRTGYKGPTLYQKIKRGDFPAPVKLSARHSIWPENEITAWLNAKARGASDDEIRALVKQLHAARAVAA